MRSEKEMLELILGVARADERIRAVCQNGSRTNPHARKDLFCDYGIVYIVRETRPFYTDPHWIDRFGQRLYLQRPEEIDRGLGLDVDFDRSYGWLIQLADGNRLDLHVQTADAADPQQDGLCLILLDKDSLFPSAPAPTGKAAHPGTISRLLQRVLVVPQYYSQRPVAPGTALCPCHVLPHLPSAAA